LTVFVVICAALVLVALLFALPPFLRRPGDPSGADRRESNLGIYREQLRDLDRDLAGGTLSPNQWQRDRDELSRRMLEDVPLEGDALAASTHGGSRVAPALVIAVLLPIAAALIYTQVGTPRALDAEASRAAAPHAGQQFTSERVEQMVSQLAQRMEKEPDNLEGWVLLGRSYSAVGRFQDASAALQRAVRLKADDPNLLADYADALAMASGQNLEGEPTALIDKALAIDPDHQKALALAGTAAYERGDFAVAVQKWERLLKTVPPDSEGTRSIQASIDEARARAGGQAAPAGKPTTEASASGRVGGVVTLAPELSDKAAPDDTLFIYARAAQGPPMPLAIQKLQVKDLPAKFSLDDSMSMAPGMSISRFPEVVVVARISKSGQAAPRTGDLEGAVGPVKAGGTDLKVLIDKVRP
jgi:cytochrome c-type biogenesis protein CcmH